MAYIHIAIYHIHIAIYHWNLLSDPFEPLCYNSYSNGTDIDIYVGLKHSGGINESVAEEFYANSQYGTSFWPVYYALRPWSSACSYYDTTIEDWISEGCEVNII